MKLTSILITVIALFAIGCSQQAPEPTPEAATTEPAATTDEQAATLPDDEAHRNIAPPEAGPAHGAMGTNAEIHLDEAVAAAWTGITVSLVDRDSGATESWTIRLGDSMALGDTGLTLRAEAFIPDFVMDEGGITSRSPEANNPAAKVVISEAGKEDFEGWLFATMPEIHPFPHERYHVLLEGGIPIE